MERVGSLDFPHRYGGCANVNDDEYKAGTGMSFLAHSYGLVPFSWKSFQFYEWLISKREKNENTHGQRRKFSLDTKIEKLWVDRKKKREKFGQRKKRNYAESEKLNVELLEKVFVSWCQKKLARYFIIIASSLWFSFHSRALSFRHVGRFS